MTRARIRRVLFLAVALWLPALLIATLEVFLAPAMLPQLEDGTLARLSMGLNAIATATVCLLFARRRPQHAWSTLAAALLVAYFTALGLCLLLRIDLAAAGIVLLLEAVLWVLAACAGTALGLRRAASLR